MIKFKKIKKILFFPIVFIVILFTLSSVAEVPAVATKNITNTTSKINIQEIIKNKKEEFSSKLIDNFSKISESKNNEAEKEVIVEKITTKKVKTTNAKSKTTKKKKKVTVKKENTKSQSQESAEQLIDSQPQKEEENNENSLQQEDTKEETKENDTSSNNQSKNDVSETKEDVSKTNESDINNAELMLLAKLIYLENGNNTDLAQLLTGNVVLNRVASSKYPNTIKGVIYQKGQYSVASKISKTVPSDRAIKNAKRLLSGERFCPKNVIYQSRFKQGSGVYKKIKGEYFCYA